jgi:hypothetical protein
VHTRDCTDKFMDAFQHAESKLLAAKTSIKSQVADIEDELVSMGSNVAVRPAIFNSLDEYYHQATLSIDNLIAVRCLLFI